MDAMKLAVRFFDFAVALLIASAVMWVVEALLGIFNHHIDAPWDGFIVGILMVLMLKPWHWFKPQQRNAGNNDLFPGQ